MLNHLLHNLSQRLMRYSKRQSRVNLYDWLEDALCKFGLSEQDLIINIGAGGDVADLLDRSGLRPLSIDIDPARNPNLIANIEDLSKLGNASVDGVICIEVLEHVKHPHLAVKELYRVMKPGSVIVGSTPFLLGIHDQPADYFRYTRHGLQMLFADFELLCLRERNSYFSAIAVLIHRRFVISSPSQKTITLLLSPILIIIIYLLKFIDCAIPAFDGTTGYFFIFKKTVR